MGVNSELRLQCLLAKFKPAGIFAKIAYFGIRDGMNVITEGEDHSSYAYFLSPEDYATFLERQKTGEAASNPRTYSPSYKIRPNIEMIRAKLETYYNLELVHEREMKSQRQIIEQKWGGKRWELPEKYKKRIEEMEKVEKLGGGDRSVFQEEEREDQQRHEEPEQKKMKPNEDANEA
ncbi:hypothetical protein L596_025407 [Steinernema carpocapsae]|uniref:Uncharacterized protein n=1 Tax=Steinernema carpocapsae TaxID=34508 RepID=A0A4U5M7N4_STECR|nr:hypothetical protein L596_025407 [Steinernema carpocapsae]